MPVLVPLGKLAHSVLIPILEPKLEDIAGQFSGEIRLVGLDQSSKDLDPAGIVLGSLDRSDEFDSSCFVPPALSFQTIREAHQMPRRPRWFSPRRGLTRYLGLPATANRPTNAACSGVAQPRSSMVRSR